MAWRALVVSRRDCASWEEWARVLSAVRAFLECENSLLRGFVISMFADACILWKFHSCGVWMRLYGLIVTRLWLFSSCTNKRYRTCEWWLFLDSGEWIGDKHEYNLQYQLWIYLRARSSTQNYWKNYVFHFVCNNLFILFNPNLITVEWIWWILHSLAPTSFSYLDTIYLPSFGVLFSVLLTFSCNEIRERVNFYSNHREQSFSPCHKFFTQF